MKELEPFEFTPFPCDFYCEKCGVSGHFEQIDEHKESCTKLDKVGYVLQVPRDWRPTKENGGQIWWCMSCRAVFASLEERQAHGPSCPHDFSRMMERAYAAMSWDLFPGAPEPYSNFDLMDQMQETARQEFENEYKEKK